MTDISLKKLNTLVLPIALAAVAVVYSMYLSGQIASLLIPELSFVSGESTALALDFEGPTGDIWFDADVQLVYANMTVREAAHWWLHKHPLFSILIWPLTEVAKTFTGDAMLAVRSVVAANAGLTLLLLWGLAARIGLQVPDRALCCLLFLASSSMIFWYSVPERFPFGTSTLLIALHAAISAPPRTVWGYAGHILASIGTLSMTITNWAAGLLATAASYGLIDKPLATIRGWFKAGRFWQDIRGPLLVSSAALIFAAILAIIQDMLFGDASLFFNIVHLFGESEYAIDYEVTALWMRPITMMVNPILVGSIGTWLEGTKLNADSLVPSTWAGGVALLLWCAILFAGIFNTARILSGSEPENARRRHLLAAAVLTLLAFIILHLLYGRTTFLYAAHTLPYLLVLAMFSLAGRWGGPIRGVMALLVVTAAANNLALFDQSVVFVSSIVQPVQ